MTHVILGKGNLGLDLKIALEQSGFNSVIFTGSDGFIWPDHHLKILELQPVCVWLAAGFGSVDACAKDMMGALATHVAMPMDLAQRLHKETKLVVFSSDYVADESHPSAPEKQTPRPKSFYACTKLWMEQGLMMSRRPNTCIVRVGSLYGSHFPAKTFPGRIRANYPTQGAEVKLPMNWVVPTPTAWLAKQLIHNYPRMFHNNAVTIKHLAPSGGCTIADWGRLSLIGKFTIKADGFDVQRPGFSRLLNTFDLETPDWKQLWGTYGI